MKETIIGAEGFPFNLISLVRFNDNFPPGEIIAVEKSLSLILFLAGNKDGRCKSGQEIFDIHKIRVF